jgi:hypothetical protein
MAESVHYLEKAHEMTLQLPRSNQKILPLIKARQRALDFQSFSANC